MSAEEAIARAKAIAARLAGTGATAATAASASAPAFNVNAVADAALAAANGGGGSGKRKRWGDQSHSQPENNGGGAPMTGSLIDEALAQAMNAKRSNTGSVGVGGGSGGGSGGYGSSSASVYGGGGGGGGGHGHQSTKKLMIPVEKYPGYNFIGLLIGPGGSKQRELVQQSGGNVKISIRGKGSSSSNDGGPGMDEPLHVLLEGMAENVSRAEALIEPLLNDPETAQAEKDRQLKGLPGASSGSTTGAASTYQYTPKPVAQILGLNGGGHYGPALGQEGIEEKIGIPNGFVGFIIGKGGESITSMQRKSGCKVQIEKEHEMEPGSTQRIITLTGATPESVSMCRGIIEEMVQERARLNESRNSGGVGGGMGGGGVGFNRMGPGSNASGQAAQLQTALSEGQSHVEVQVPNNDVGLVIGKGGSTIRSIQERSGANVQIPQGPDHDNPAVRTVNITHPQMSGAEFAKTLIEEVLGSKTHHGGGGGGGMGGGGYGNNPNDATVQVQVRNCMML
uniref:K Homology domain-containing protein n=1 Tax=Chaetoceros debilis TaxID=122233 RepID=A0A7S3VAH2_9STRA